MLGRLLYRCAKHYVGISREEVNITADFENGTASGLHRCEHETVYDFSQCFPSYHRSLRNADSRLPAF